MTLGDAVKEAADRINKRSAESDIFKERSTLNVLMRDHLSMTLYKVLRTRPYGSKLYFSLGSAEGDGMIVVKTGDIGRTLLECVKLDFKKKVCTNSTKLYLHIIPLEDEKSSLELEDFMDMIFYKTIDLKKSEIETKLEEIAQAEADIETLRKDIESLEALA